MKNSIPRLRLFPGFARALALAVALLVPAVAQAHPGPPGHVHGFANGFIHPWTGLDHLCAMFAVGLWAAQRGGRALWAAPAAFLSFMAVGMALGAAAPPIPWVEQGVAASVFVLGILLAGSLRLPLPAVIALLSFFAIFHGLAHSQFSHAAAGILLATACLHLSGMAAGLAAKRFGSPAWIRGAGAAIAACGLCLCLA
ncbi:MAG: HupE/UreJ family protein [Verrucomicrobia bacterium]|nr:HupE/UreJ family protein [Verrucomicrobiota bacterium]MDE3098853.1 HupE/UreJ family protein [Verrucomicrobiota bacterium]